MIDLKNRVAIVTGGSSGIGKSISEALASIGCHVVIVGRDKDKINRAIEEIKLKQKNKLIGFSADVSNECDVAEMIGKVMEHYGHIDILFNNAGISFPKKPEKMEVEEWDMVFDNNLKSVFICSKCVYSHMKKKGKGKIINIGSMLSTFGSGVLAAYSASKGGVVQLTKSLAVAWAKQGIQVNALIPGWIKTQMTYPNGIIDTSFEEYIISRTPAGRWGKPSDIIGAAIFLSSELSDFITGSVICIDGGFSAKI